MSLPGFGFDVRVSTPSGIPNTRPLALMASQVYAPWSASFTSRMVRVPWPFSLLMEILRGQKCTPHNRFNSVKLSRESVPAVGSRLHKKSIKFNRDCLTMYTAGYAQHEHPEAATFGVGEHHKYLIRKKLGVHYESAWKDRSYRPVGN